MAAFRRRAEFSIEKSDPFAHDKLGFHELVPPLTRLLQRTTGPYVIAVSSEYGTGKTTFLRMWQAYLEQEGARTLFFDAWAHDFIDPPLTALIGEIETQIKSAKTTKAATRALHSAGLAAIQTLGPTAIREGIAVAAIALSRVALGETATERLQNLPKAIGTAAGDFAKDQIEKYKNQKKTLADFRNALQKFAKAVAGKANAAAQNRYLPLVFFIDELDRCRPTYSIELLETLKHLFAVPGVVFVLGLNREALSDSLQAVYGPSFNGRAYLRRFIDLPYLMPPPPLDKFCAQLAEEFVAEEIKIGIQPSQSYYDWAGFSNSVPYRAIAAAAGGRYGNLFRRSLRDLEQVFSRAGAALASMAADQKVEPSYFMFLLIAQDAEPEAYAKFRNGQVSGIVDVVIAKYGKLSAKTPIDIIVSEAMSVHHMSAEDRQKKENNLLSRLNNGERIREEESIPYALLRHGVDRITRTTRLVDFAQRFDESAKSQV